MKRKVDAERLLRSFYADELAEASARTEDRHPGVRPVADRGQSPAAPREREPPARAARERAYGPVFAAAASLAVLAAGAIAPRPAPADVPGLFIMVETFGELARSAGLLEPFEPRR